MFRFVVLFLIGLCVFVGCCEHQRYGQQPIDNTIDLVKTLQTANVASAPMNPFAIPIGVGLSGMIAVLESLRRVEKGKRKYAEHELNNNNNNKSHS